MALAAQGLGARVGGSRLPGAPAGAALRAVLRAVTRMDVLQIDSVNVLARSQELPLFSRIGPYPRHLLAEAVDAGRLWEYHVHQASFTPADRYPLHRWRMERTLQWGRYERLVAARPGLIESIYERVAATGAVVAGDLGMREGPRGTWWDYDDGKIALEALYYQGRLAVRRRARDFARVYDLPSRVLPAAVLAEPAVPEPLARKELLLLAARACGVATLADLSDYHRQKPSVCRPLVAELVAEGRLEEVAVEGWKEPGYVLPGVSLPRAVDARCLVSPFDPVVWNRDRALRLFGFHYRIEIYVPAPQRRFGYYVLPFILGDRIVGRVDLKADRAGGRLLVQAAWVEDDVRPAEVAGPLAEELDLMAGWLGLGDVAVVGRGDLAPALAAAVAGG